MACSGCEFYDKTQFLFRINKGIDDITDDKKILGTCVGRIDYSSHHNEMRFAYAPEYLASADATPLSYSLPLQSGAFDSERTTVFFENQLPPDEVRRKLGPVLHLSRHNVFGCRVVATRTPKRKRNMGVRIPPGAPTETANMA